MNMRYFKAISMLLAFMLIFLTLSSTVFAIPTEGFLEKLKAMDASVTLDGENPGTVTVAVFATEAMSVYGIEGVWDTTEQEGSNKLTLSKIESDIITFDGMNYADASSGKVLWTDDTFSNPAVLENETKLLTATYTVPADTPEGTYTVRFLSQVFTADDYNPDETAKYFTATITVTTDTTVDTETDSEIDTNTESDTETDSEINTDTDTDTDKSNIMLGDVTGDGQVKMNDVVMIQKAIAKLIELTDEQTLAADVNRDGKVTMADVVTIQKFIAKLITEF